MPRKSYKIAIADDNWELSAMMQECIIAEPDMELVGVAYNGEEILNIIQDKKPDVVILDIIMPHLDGIGVLEKLNAGIAWRPKIIMLTAFGQETITKRVLELGADYYVLKPFSIEVLLNRIRQLFSAEVENGKYPATAVSAAANILNTTAISNEYTNDAGITTTLRQLGVPVHFKGYQYLREAIAMCMAKDTEMMSSLTTELYPRLADKYSTSNGGVEKAIYHAIEIAWERGNQEMLQQVFGGYNEKQKKPTNAEFIAGIADILRVQNKK